MLLLAVFATVLYRRTGQHDVVVCSPTANRPRVELEDLVGFLSTTVAIRLGLAGNPTFRDFLDQVRTVTVETFAHQEVPFERVVEAVRPERIPGVNPLAQINVRVNVGEPAELVLEGARAERIQLDVSRPRFDLALELNVGDASLDCTFVYRTDLFDEGTIESLAEDFQAFLEQVLDDPEQRLLSLEPAGPAGTRTTATDARSIRRFRDRGPTAAASDSTG